MAVLAGYSRHKMFDEMNSPLFTNLGDGAVPLVYSPEEQKERARANLGVDVDTIMVAAGTDGLGAGTIQEVLQALASRIQVLEDA